MNLAKRLAPEFSPTIRSRGSGYFWQNRVRILHGSEMTVDARVRGARQYEVSLDFSDGVLVASCDCAFFDSSPCKHLWATILAADGRGFLSAASDEDLILDCDSGIPLLEGELPRPILTPVPTGPPAWKKRIEEITARRNGVARTTEDWPGKREILYVVDTSSQATESGLILRLHYRDRKADGGYSRIAPLTLNRDRIPELPLADLEIVSALTGADEHYAYSYARYGHVPQAFLVRHPLARIVLSAAARTGRCFLRSKETPEDLTPLAWDEGGPWSFGVELRRDKKGWVVAGAFRRGEERLELSEVAMILQGGLVFTRDRMAALAEDTPFEWISHLWKVGTIRAAEGEQEELLATLLHSPGISPPDVPEELNYERVSASPRPGLRLTGSADARGTGKLRAELWFDYEGQIATAETAAGGFYNSEARRFLCRDAAAEKSAAELLHELGLRHRVWSYGDPGEHWELGPARLPRTVRALVEAGWHIEAEGKIFRKPGTSRISVSTGVDWFELHGSVDYGDTTAKLPALLDAVRRGESMVRLDDGTYGVVPEEWLRRIGVLAGAGKAEEEHIRFRKGQAGLLDALLAVQPEADCDEAFVKIREELQRFHGVESANQPAGFVGTMRDYQREGLGWMEFLRKFSFGGCLADDMGVGKTAQVLAMLETRRELREAGEAIGPSLVVVPRSLVFNWKQESEKFTPRLRVLDYTGAAREGNFDEYHLVLTTYGTLRRDALRFREAEFDYVVLDEAQAVKNSATESAKAVRLLRGNHRLALSGTPVENHLGELWSLFEFLNPGMLGTAGVFKLAGAAGRGPDEDTRRLLAHALRPFILRRTKEQVARELPAKTEQTVYCEMEPAQRKLYNELRQHYRQSLLQRVDTAGLAKSKIHVLEALLRLRQAACHPGLLDASRRGEGSAKLDVLLEQLREVLDEGHKALVFSQFTSMLAIVREHLDAAGIDYEYLDGATRDRQSCVERFQNDPECRLFLISLKAGGLGLNLTAAEYVFLLDPWWNPAVEAQAIDRAHRIGQTHQVFGYRLIARDTVEEKVLELQKSKRDLAAAILGEDNSLIRNLKREDLELLLS